MGTAANTLAARLREQRMKWVDLAGEDGKRVRIIRPTETEMGSLIQGGHFSIGLAEVKRFVVDWEGFTEADLLGPAIGAADAVPFDAALWAELVADRVRWVRQLAQDLLDHAVSHRLAADEDAKNS